MILMNLRSFLLIVLSAILASSCADGNWGTSPEPRIHIVSPHVNMGEAFEGQILSHTFIVENRGSRPLTLDVLNTSCGCTTARPIARDLAPEDESTIDVEVDTYGRTGLVKETITIRCNDPSEPAVTLQVQLEVKPLVSVEPNRLEFTRNRAQVRSEQSFLIRFLDGSQPRIIGIHNPAEDSLQLRLEPPVDAGDGDEPVLVHVDLTSAGLRDLSSRSNVRILVFFDHPVRGSLTLPVTID